MTQPNFYDGTNYTRQAVIIDKDFYALIRSLADADMTRRLKSGDVMKIVFELASLHLGKEQIESALNSARSAMPISKRKITQALDGLSDKQKAQIESIIKEKK